MSELNGTDEALAAAASHGDRAAFESLVHRYGSHLHGVVEHQVGDANRALDLVQDIWLKVYRAIPRFRPDGSFRSWLFSIALNHVRDSARADRRAKIVYLDDFRTPPPGTASDDPHGRVEEKSAIEAAMREVAEPYRSAVILVDVMEMSYEEAAAALDCRVGTVKSRVNRGRLAFRDEYVRASSNAAERRDTAEGATS